jgi:hypothetical protein
MLCCSLSLSRQGLQNSSHISPIEKAQHTLDQTRRCRCADARRPLCSHRRRQKKRQWKQEKAKLKQEVKQAQAERDEARKALSLAEDRLADAERIAEDLRIALEEAKVRDSEG